MRLGPIEKPKGLMMRFAYWGIRRQFGKVITPVKVVIARMPRALRLTNEIAKFELKGIRLEPELHIMVGMLASQINGCGFCMDLGRAMGSSRAPRDGEGQCSLGISNQSAVF
jgi:alkylhydroperoxidase family enzyme